MMEERTALPIHPFSQACIRSIANHRVFKQTIPINKYRDDDFFFVDVK